MIYRTPIRLILLLVGQLICATVIEGAQQPAPAVVVTGGAAQSLTLTAGDLAQMPRASVTTTTGGIEKRYQGVWLHEILKRAGIPLGEQLRGRALTTYVLVGAQDGYQVLFSLAELDPAFADNQILLADTMNGKPLFGEEGDFRIVAPREKRGARSVRMVTTLEVVQLRK